MKKMIDLINAEYDMYADALERIWGNRNIIETQKKRRKTKKQM